MDVYFIAVVSSTWSVSFDTSYSVRSRVCLFVGYWGIFNIKTKL